MAEEMPDLAFQVISDLPAACAMADIIVSATGSAEILVRGEWIRPGTHTDFLGNHHATKRECDTEMVTRSRVFVDTRANCFKEAGEILLPVDEGAFSLDQVAGELSDLCRGSVPARQNDQEITLFKSVGCALGDLCGAYWYPLYAYVRRSGCTVEEAQDLTQEFFARVLAERDENPEVAQFFAGYGVRAGGLAVERDIQFWIDVLERQGTVPAGTLVAKDILFATGDSPATN